jgi:hypothetical protein
VRRGGYPGVLLLRVGFFIIVFLNLNILDPFFFGLGEALLECELRVSCLLGRYSTTLDPLCQTAVDLLHG